MSEGDDLKNLPVKVAGMNELERSYQALDRYSGRMAPPYGGDEGEGGRSEFSMRDIMYVLFRHKWKILLIFLGLSIGTIFYIATMGQQYESEARVFIRGDRTGVTVDPTGEGNSFLKGSRDGSSVRSEIGIMTSQALAEAVVDKLGPEVVLDITRNAKPRPKGWWASFLNANPRVARGVEGVENAVDKTLAALHLTKPPLTLRQQAVQAIVTGLDVAETMQTSFVLRATYRANSPQTAQDVLNALIEAYQQKHIDIHKTAVSPEFFDGKIAALRTQLAAKENELDAERKRLNISSLDNQKAMLLTQYNTFDTALKESAMQISSLKAKIGQFDQLLNKRATGTKPGAGKSVTPPAPRSNPALDQIRGRLLELKLREADLASRFTDKNGELIDVRNQIKELEKLIKSESRGGSGSGGLDLIAQADSPASELEMQGTLAKVELEAENAREAMLAKELNNTRNELNTLLGNEKGIKQLEREVSLLESEYQQYLNSSQVADISNELDRDKVSNVGIVQRATLPAEPVKSQRKLLALLGFGIFLSLAAGIGWAFGLEFCDHSVKTNEDVEKHLGLPVLVAIPYVKHHKPLLQEGNS